MKKILITGASGGIGSSIVNKFIQNDYKLILTSSSDTTIKKLKDEVKTCKRLCTSWIKYLYKTSGWLYRSHGRRSC